MFDGLTPLAYAGIIADPPWHFETRSAKGAAKSPQAQYPTMTVDEIAALPVDHLAAPDCLLLLWTTFPMLPRAFDVLAAWRFRYVTGGAWHKRTAGGHTAFGTGYWLRSACEPFLLAKIGNPPCRPSGPARSIRNVVDAPARSHSRKPDEAYRIIETLVAGPYLELFARQRRPGWEAWGDETDRFVGSEGG